MLHSLYLIAACIIASTAAILPDAQIARQEIQNQNPGPQSLPNLLDLTLESDLASGWSLQGNMHLEEGRLVVKKDSGSIWANSLMDNSRDEWTVEVVFRNSEQVEVDDHLFYDTNGFALWILDASTQMLSDFENFGGPRRFDGFQFLINNKDKRGLKIYANSGDKDTENKPENSVGGCDINYLDSMVPFTLRVSYLASQNWFKVQIDNNLCFKTEAITFAKIKGKLRLGVSASTNEVSKEYWEVMKLNIYPYLTEDAIDDHGIITGGTIKRVTITKTATPTAGPAATRQSLMEKTREFQENHNRDTKGHLHKEDFDAFSGALSTKLEAVKELIEKIDTSKVAELAGAVDEMKKIQMQQLEVLADMRSAYGNFEKLLASQYKEMGQSLSVLHEEVIKKIKEHQFDMNTIGDKVDVLMANHKDLLDHYKSLTKSNAGSEVFGVIVKWVLLPLVIGIAVLALFVYRLRKDIKHSKLL